MTKNTKNDKIPLEPASEKTRTALQNRSIHLYFTLLANELNDAGLDMRVVLKPTIEISWTKENIKEYLWKPIQHAMKLKDSTTELTTGEIGQIYEVLNRHIGEKFRIHVPFPSVEQTKNYLQSLAKGRYGN